jgi:hypothetical protein
MHLGIPGTIEYRDNAEFECSICLRFDEAMSQFQDLGRTVTTVSFD